MRITIIIITVLLLFSYGVNGQTRTIQGRIISESLVPKPWVNIEGPNRMLFGETDSNGRFKIEIPQDSSTLIIIGLNLEITTIRLNGDCDTVEVVIMINGNYDYISSSQIDRERLKRFKKLPKLHLEAYNKGLFMKKSICYSRGKFEPMKPVLDKIHSERE